GKRGATSVNYRVNVGRHTPTALPDLITNSAEYMEMYNEAASRSGISFRFEEDQIEAYRNATERTQYPNFDAVANYINQSTVHGHNPSMNGGGEKSPFNTCFGQLDQQAMTKGDHVERHSALLDCTSQL